MNNQWGTVCDDFWGTADATVVCRQLGYSPHGQWHIPRLPSYIEFNSMVTPTGAVAFGNAHFGAGTGPVLLDSVDCSGRENNLTDCAQRSFVSCYYSHRGAGVRCQGTYCNCSVLIHSQKKTFSQIIQAGNIGSI